MYTFLFFPIVLKFSYSNSILFSSAFDDPCPTNFKVIVSKDKFCATFSFEDFSTLDFPTFCALAENEIASIEQPYCCV